MFLVITQEMLNTSLDTRALNAAHKSSSAQTSEEGVLANRLEATSAEGRTLHVDGRAEDDVGALGDGFAAHGLAGFFEQFLVKGRAEGGSAGEAGGWDAVEEFGAADAVGTV